MWLTDPDLSPKREDTSSIKLSILLSSSPVRLRSSAPLNSCE